MLPRYARVVLIELQYQQLQYNNAHSMYKHQIAP